MKIKVGVDIDGVCADTVGAMQVLMGMRHGVDLIDNLTGWWTGDEEINMKLREIVDNPQFYRWIPPVVDAPWGVRQLANRSDKVYYVTHRPDSVYAITEFWLHRWGFPILPIVNPRGPKLAIAKHLGLNYFIDDRASTVLELQDAGIAAWLFRCYYYGDTTPCSILRFNNWQDLVETFLFDVAGAV